MSEDSATVPPAVFALGTTAVIVLFVTVEQAAGSVPNWSGARVGVAEPLVPDWLPASVESPELEPEHPVSSSAGTTAQASSPARRGAVRSRRSMGRGVLCLLLGACARGAAHSSYELGIHLK